MRIQTHFKSGELPPGPPPQPPLPEIPPGATLDQLQHIPGFCQLESANLGTAIWTVADPALCALGCPEQASAIGVACGIALAELGPVGVVACAALGDGWDNACNALPNFCNDMRTWKNAYGYAHSILEKVKIC